MFADISLLDWLLLIVRWIHITAATMWAGGGIFFVLVIRPLVPKIQGIREAMPIVGARYRELVDFAIGALAVTGIILTVSRVTTQDATTAWFIVFGVKLATALWMFGSVWRIRKRGSPLPVSGIRGRVSSLIGYDAVVAASVFVFFLASLMRLLVEKN